MISAAVKPKALPSLKLMPFHAHQHGASTGGATASARCTIALVGQPNVGKSTVFNMLTGLNQHVGNWPGKTIEQKVGTFKHGEADINLIDLPGTYGLTANSEEERIARDYLMQARPDVVMAVVNAAILERSLYLVAELLTLGLPLVVGLNMLDVAAQRGMTVEPHVLAAALGVPVIPLVAAKNVGVRELVDAALAVAAEPQRWHPALPEISAEHRPILAEIQARLQASGMALPYPAPWVALKLLEGDAELTQLVRHGADEATWAAVERLLLAHEDAYLDIASGRYEWIGRMMRAAVSQPKGGVISFTDRLDRVATHPLAGLALLFAAFGAVFWLTYTVATPITAGLAAVLGALTAAVGGGLANAPGWLQGLIVDGLLGGVGTVFTFLPILVIFFAVLGLLEDSGYLARAAYVMDRFMHLMGLHGKSFLPLFLGFGCNVPAVLGARIIEERRARFLTILLAPLVPCTARLAVIAFLAPAFFGAGAALASWGLVTMNLLLLAGVGIAVNRLAFRGEQSAFIMELPLYHLPNLRTVGLYVWNNTLSFIKKAGSLILIASAVIWALSTLPTGDMEHSLLAGFGRWLEPAGRWLGLGDWRLLVALLTSFVAKENTIAALGILFGAEEGMASQVAAVLTPAGRLAFMVVQMLFIPCLATVAVIKQETASWRWTAFSLAILLALSLGGAALVYQVGRLVIG